MLTGRVCVLLHVDRREGRRAGARLALKAGPALSSGLDLVGANSDWSRANSDWSSPQSKL